MKMLLPIFLSMSIILSCQQDHNRFAEEKNLPAQEFHNVSYGADTLQRMDVYLPEGRSKVATPSLVLIHGGSWNGGSKSDFTAYIDSLQKRMPGYAIFNLNYRLFNGNNIFPTQEQDVKKALEFIAGKKDEYSINHDKIVLMGASAGGHLALLQAYKYEVPRIAGVIDFFGPTDLTTMYLDPWHPYIPVALQMVTGTNPKQDAALYHQSSPINFVTARSAPTLIFHGGNDPVVHVSQSRALKKKLEKAGVAHDLVVYPTQRHGWYGATLSNSFDIIESFLATNVK